MKPVVFILGRKHWWLNRRQFNYIEANGGVRPYIVVRRMKQYVEVHVAWRLGPEWRDESAVADRFRGLSHGWKELGWRGRYLDSVESHGYGVLRLGQFPHGPHVAEIVRDCVGMLRRATELAIETP